MRQLFALTFNYHLRYMYKYFFLLLIWTIFLGIFYVLFVVSNKDLFWFEVILLTVGGQPLTEMGLIQLMIALFPYFILGLLVELYINRAMGSLAVQSLIRINNKVLLYSSHFTSLMILVGLFYVAYMGVLTIVSIYFFYGTSTPLGFQRSYVKESDFLFLVFKIVMIQVIGAYFIAMLQLLITKWINRFRMSIWVIMILALFHIVYPNSIFPMGQQVFIGQIDLFANDENKLSLESFLYIHIFLSIASFIVVFKDRGCIIWEKTK